VVRGRRSDVLAAVCDLRDAGHLHPTRNGWIATAARAGAGNRLFEGLAKLWRSRAKLESWLEGRTPTSARPYPRQRASRRVREAPARPCRISGGCRRVAAAEDRSRRRRRRGRCRACTSVPRRLGDGHARIPRASGARWAHRVRARRVSPTATGAPELFQIKKWITDVATGGVGAIVQRRGTTLGSGRAGPGRAGPGLLAGRERPGMIGRPLGSAADAR
jgi:hypothetical protein